MKEKETNNTITENKGCSNHQSIPNISDNFNSINKSSFVPSNNLDFLIKRLSNPRFLGSIHLKKEMNPNYEQIENLIANENELKLNQSLKNTIFNPITKLLIILAIIFNIFWFLAIYLS